MGIRADVPIPGGTKNIKVSGLLYESIYRQVPELRDGDHLHYAFTLTPEQQKNVSERMFHVLHGHTYFNNFQYAQEYWEHINDVEKAYALLHHSLTGNNLSFG